jgi:hypothetical protein
MREINGIPSHTDEDLRHIAKMSMEFDSTSHGGSVNNGDPLSCEKIIQAYEQKSSELAEAFEAFVVDLLN